MRIWSINTDTGLGKTAERESDRLFQLKKIKTFRKKDLTFYNTWVEITVGTGKPE